MSQKHSEMQRRVEWSCPCGESGVYILKPEDSDSLGVFQAAVQHTEQTLETGCCADLRWQIVCVPVEGQEASMNGETAA